MIIAKSIYGDDLKKNVLILNASQDRGINIVRNKIKSFAQKSTYNKYPFKLIILDESDSMTADAQSALRRILEHYSKITRFCFICNYVSKMIDPIISRCSIIRFKPIKKEYVKEKLEYIAKNEKLIDYDKYISKICELTNGDMRQSIILLETINTLSKGKNIELSDLNELSGIIPDSIIIDLLNNFKNGPFNKIKDCCTNILFDGYSIYKIYKQLCIKILEDDTLNDIFKSTILIELYKFDKKRSENTDELIQLLSFATFFFQKYNNYNPKVFSVANVK